MNKSRKIGALFGVLALTISGAASADYIGVKYLNSKYASCDVTYKYYDGDKGRVTCTVTDGSSRSLGSMITLSCSGNDEIRHVKDSDSAILISAEGDCDRTRIAEIKAKKTAGKDSSKTVPSFDGKNYMSNGGQIGSALLDSRVNNKSHCYQQINVDQLQYFDRELKVKLSSKKSYTTTGYGATTTCNRTYSD